MCLQLKIGPAMGYYGVLAMFGVLNFAVSIFVEVCSVCR